MMRDYRVSRCETSRAATRQVEMFGFRCPHSLAILSILVACMCMTVRAQDPPFKQILEAAEEGDAGAQCSLGDMYYKGEGVDQDHAEAAHWYRRNRDESPTVRREGGFSVPNPGPSADEPPRRSTEKPP